MPNFNQYKLKIQTDLNTISSHMKPDDIKRCAASIAKATTVGELDAISLNWKFHKFRVERRQGK